MDLDVYAGPLSRYYLNEWETAIERVVGDSGAFLLEESGGARPSPALMAEVQASIESWLARVNEGLEPELSEDIAWNDAPDGPYATVQVGIANYSALIAWSAYARYAFDRPYDAPRDLSADPAVQAAMTTAVPPRIITQLNCEIWLPGDFAFSMAVRAPDGDGAALCSTGALREALNEFNQATWRASPDTILAWGERGPPLAGRVIEVEPGRFAPAAPPEVIPPVDSPFEHSAQYAFSVMAQIVSFARENDMPVFLHGGE